MVCLLGLGIVDHNAMILTSLLNDCDLKAEVWIFFEIFSCKQQAKDSFDRKQPNNGWVSGMHAMTVSYAMVCICNKENKHVMHDAIMLADHPIVMVHNLLKS